MVLLQLQLWCSFIWYFTILRHSPSLSYSGPLWFSIILNSFTIINIRSLVYASVIPLLAVIAFLNLLVFYILISLELSNPTSPVLGLHLSNLFGLELGSMGAILGGSIYVNNYLITSSLHCIPSLAPLVISLLFAFSRMNIYCLIVFIGLVYTAIYVIILFVDLLPLFSLWLDDLPTLLFHLESYHSNVEPF